MQNPFKTAPKTVDGILSAFTKTIEDLNQVAEATKIEATDLQLLSMDLHSEAEQVAREAVQAEAEADRALEISKNLENLIKA